MPQIIRAAHDFVAKLEPCEIRRSSDFQVTMVSEGYTRFTEVEYRQQLAYMESRVAFMEVCREVAPNSVLLSYAKAVPYGALNEFASNMLGIMLVYSHNGMNYHFTHYEDAVLFKLTYR